MSTIRTTIDIGASPETVWRVLTHFPSYSKWNPFIREVRGAAEPGARLKLRMRFSGKRSYWFTARVVKTIPASELHWRDRFLFGGLFDSVHAFIIVPNGVMGVKFIQRESFSGLLVPLILPFVAKKRSRGFERMNVALKKLAETKR
jgi:hypothetical protein